MNKTETQHSDPLFLTQHGEAGTKAWQQQARAGGRPKVGEEGKEEEN